MGYTLIPDQSLQVFFGLVGATRGGKGVISKVWTELLGAENVIGPQLSTLGTQFGLQNWIGKPLAIIPDGRQGRNDHNGIMLERLLAITGGDSVTVDRKNRDHWTGVLPTRIVLVSNLLPTFSDGSLALVHRLVPLYFKRSFVGGEDRTLVRRLLGELPAILRRCLAARQRLKARGFFIVPAASQELLGEFRDSVSPEYAFVEECCDMGPFESRLDDLYRAWEAWCREHGRAHTSSLAAFSRRLKAAFPGEVEVARHRKSGDRFRTVYGIRVSGQGGAEDFWT
jgi:putative DNA primase/helicase